MDTVMESQRKSNTVLTPLLAGGVSGLSVDVALYPLDTLKTRLQSSQGFHKAGGFKGVYRGLSAVMAGSMPTSALFFLSYEKTKQILIPRVDSRFTPMVHMFAASIGEVLACVFRVPMDIAKQRKQTYVGTKHRSNVAILVEAFKSEGLRRGLYRGFFSTVVRDLPFSFIQLPIWEMLKNVFRRHNDGHVNSFQMLQSALCGSVAGGFAAAVTTPLDLAKTRIMLAEGAREDHKHKIRPVLLTIYTENGVRGLFAGLTPRLTAFTLGGFVFFGAYEFSKSICDNML